MERVSWMMYRLGCTAWFAGYKGLASWLWCVKDWFWGRGRGNAKRPLGSRNSTREAGWRI